MLQACAQTDASSNKKLLSKLQKIAPPIIRPCIIDRVKQLPPGEIAKKAAHDRNATQSDDHAQAQFSVEYLSETCFSNLDIDPSPTISMSPRLVMAAQFSGSSIPSTSSWKAQRNTNEKY